MTNPIKFPVTEDGEPIVDEEDMMELMLLGPVRINTTEGQILVTQDQWNRLSQGWLGPLKDDNAFEEAMVAKATIKFMQFHGSRLMLYLAGKGFLEEGQDPVEIIKKLLENPV